MVYTHFISDYNYVINENEYIILPSKKYIGVVVYIWIIRCSEQSRFLRYHQ